MKWQSILLSLVLGSSAISKAQNSDGSPEPFLKTGDYLVSLSYGYPNWGVFNLNEHFKSQSVTEGTASGLAPISVSAVYFFNDRVSFSLTGMFNSWGGSWRTDDFMGLNNYSFSVNRTRVLFGAEYHWFDFDAKKTDLYTGLSIGGNSVRVDFDSSDPEWTPKNNNYFLNLNDNIDFPITGRGYAGIRYFFNQNLGLNMEVGIGGSTLSFGINYKF